MTIKDYAQLTPEELLSSLHSSAESGLSTHEATERLKKYGANAVESKENSWLSIMLRQLHSPFMYLLFFAATLSLCLQDKLNSALIFFSSSSQLFLVFIKNTMQSKLSSCSKNTLQLPVMFCAMAPWYVSLPISLFPATL
jgi:magnesium-transporting ATPase (P-type)